MTHEHGAALAARPNPREHRPRLSWCRRRRLAVGDMMALLSKETRGNWVDTECVGKG